MAGNIMKNGVNQLLLILFLVFPLSTQAASYKSVIAFGDSLTDNGNIRRFTDGAIWVETLASSFEASLYDFAHSGATTGYDNPAAGLNYSGLQWQLENYSASADDALFTLWIGANDLEQGRSFETAAENIATALQSLYADGARDILVGNLPNIGATPRFIDYGLEIATLATQWTMGFNVQLATVLSVFEQSYPDVNLYRLDVYELFENFTPQTSEWRELFWTDGFHPSSVGHQLIADTALTHLEAVPAPASILLIGSGIIGLALLRRKLA